MQTTVIILVTQNKTLIFTHHLWCFEHAWRLEVSAVKKKKVKIAGELFNSIKNNQHLILPVSFEIQYNYVYHRFVLIT